MPKTDRTELVCVRQPTAAERLRGAEVVFERKDGDGRAFTILANRCYESWQQWGERVDVLADNYDDVEGWRQSYRK